MRPLLRFLNLLEAARIHYALHHHRPEFIMVKVDVPGERWEVEFGADGALDIEVFGASGGVYSNPAMLESSK